MSYNNRQTREYADFKHFEVSLWPSYQRFKIIKVYNQMTSHDFQAQTDVQ